MRWPTALLLIALALPACGGGESTPATPTSLAQTTSTASAQSSTSTSSTSSTTTSAPPAEEVAARATPWHDGGEAATDAAAAVDAFLRFTGLVDVDATGLPELDATEAVAELRSRTGGDVEPVTLVTLRRTDRAGWQVIDATSPAVPVDAPWDGQPVASPLDARVSNRLWVADEVVLSIWTDDGELVAGPSTVSSGSGVFAAGTFDAVLSWPEERRGPAVLIAEVRGTNGTLAVTTVAIELAETTQPFAGPQPATVLGPVGDQRVDIEYQRGVRLTLHEPGPCDGELRPVVATGGPGGPVFAEAFAERGYVVANVSWRTPGYTEPSLSAESLRAVSFAVNDLAVAVQWLRFHAEELCLDEDRITAMGHSFGGITALSLAYSAGELESGELVSVDALGPAAEVGDPPPGSPPGLEHVDQRPNAVVSFSGFALADTIEAGEPPAMLVHGRNDSTVPFALAEQTCAAAAAVAVVCELVPHDAGHGIVEDRFDAVDAFLSADHG